MSAQPKQASQAIANNTADLQSLCQRAEQGDAAALQALQPFLDANPDVWRRYGDLGLQAEASLVQLASGPNLLLAESLTRKLKEMKRELAGPSASPLELLLIDRIGACWLQVSYLDGMSAQAHKASTKQSDDLRRRQEGAHRRLLTAVRALETHRKYLKPTGQETPAASDHSLPEAIASRLGRRSKLPAEVVATN